MRVTICELQNEAEDLPAAWDALVAHTRAERSELVLLPEMCFFPWFAWRQDFDAAVWQSAVDAHEHWLARLPELAPAAVLGSRPVERDGRRVNEGYVRDARGGYRAAHHKYYLPDEDGYWEASWYERGDGTFAPAEAAGLRVGFLICTELWFNERARAYGRQGGVHLIANPRATEKATVDKWLVAGRAAAVAAGAYCLSSNPINPPGRAANVGGQGWAVDPDGEVLALTTRGQPFVTVTLDPARAERAKSTYPRYVRE